MKDQYKTKQKLIEELEALRKELVKLKKIETEQKKAKEKLWESEEKYRNIFKNAPVGIGVASPDGKVVNANKTMQAITGYSVEELKKINLANTYVNPEDKKALLEAIERDGGVVNFSTRLKRKDGTPYDALLNAFRIHLGDEDYFQTICVDITESKRAEEKLQKSEKLLRAFMSAIQESAFVVDTEGVVVIANETLAQRMGTNLNELIGTCIYNHLPPEIARERKTQVEEVIRTGKPLRYEDRRAGVWIDSFVYPILSEEGKVMNVGVLAVDITERKRAEEALRAAEARYRIVANNTYDWEFWTSPEGRFLYSSPSCKRITGYAADEFIAEPDLLCRIVHPDDRLDFDRHRDEVTQEMAPHEVEFRVIRPDGTVRWIGHVCQPVFASDGHFLGMRSSDRDITERKRAEAELRFHGEIMKNMSEGVYLIRLSDGLIVYTNPKFERMFGYEAGEMIGKPITIVNAPTGKSPEQTAREIIGVLNRTGGWYGEINNIKKDGTLFWCYAGCSLFEHPEYGKVIVAVHTDITERKRVEKERERLFKQVRTSHERLQSLSRRLVEVQEVERRDIVRKLHDEVGQNLTALSINMNILRGQLPAEAATKIEPRLNDSLKLVEETVERIRDVMAELRPPVLDDYGITAALYWYGKQFSERTGIAAVVEGEELMPRLPLATETALFRITQEALTNVAKHAQAKQVIISLKSREEKVFLTIADDGIGFEQQQQQQWGLINVRERAQAVGGTLNIETAAGKGTKIMVEVPRNH